MCQRYNWLPSSVVLPLVILRLSHFPPSFQTECFSMFTLQHTNAFSNFFSFICCLFILVSSSEYRRQLRPTQAEDLRRFSQALNQMASEEPQTMAFFFLPEFLVTIQSNHYFFSLVIILSSLFFYNKIYEKI